MFCGSDLCTCSSHFQEALDNDAKETDYTGRGGGSQQEKAKREPERAQVHQGFRSHKSYGCQQKTCTKGITASPSMEACLWPFSCVSVTQHVVQ